MAAPQRWIRIPRAGLWPAAEEAGGDRRSPATARSIAPRRALAKMLATRFALPTNS